jgi:hypothetical protein
VESLFASVKTIFDKRPKHPVLLVDAVKESANMTVAPQSAFGKLH